MPTYNVSVVCSNCGYETTISIPQGTRIIDWLSDNANRKCSGCGCLSLNKG